MLNLKNISSADLYEDRQWLSLYNDNDEIMLDLYCYDENMYQELQELVIKYLDKKAIKFQKTA